MAKRKRKAKGNTQPFWRMTFLVYAGLMIWLLFGRSQGWTEGLTYRQMLQENINLKPFYTIDNYINVIFHYPQSPYFTHCIINLAGNVLMFIPAGWLLPRIFQAMRKFFPFFLTCVLSIVFIETFQLLTLLGSFDVDDIILNLIGMLIGFIIYACKPKK